MIDLTPKDTPPLFETRGTQAVYKCGLVLERGCLLYPSIAAVLIALHYGLV
jgi:hypothetical protein